MGKSIQLDVHYKRAMACLSQAGQTDRNVDPWAQVGALPTWLRAQGGPSSLLKK